MRDILHAAIVQKIQQNTILKNKRLRRRTDQKVQKIQQNTILKNSIDLHSKSSCVQKIQQNTILKNRKCDLAYYEMFKKYNKIQSLRTET